MGRFQFSLASSSDDAQLRARMRLDRMEGDIAISFRREPSYFAAAKLHGDSVEVIKCVDTASDEIIGLGNRSTLDAFVDGKKQRIGYLSDLRGAPQYRKGMLLARGYQYLRKLHEQDPVPLYYTVIYEGNHAAFENLLGARAGLPAYHDFGSILTPAIHLDFPKSALRLQGVKVVSAQRSDLPKIVEFLNAAQSEKQFAPVYREADFYDGRFAGMVAEDFFLAIANDKIVGSLAAWDQKSLRQTHVESYSSRLAGIRPFYNLAARFSPLKALPKIGERIPYIYFSCLAAARNDQQIMRVLFRSAYNALRKGPWHYAIAGLHATDPLASVLHEYRRIPAAGRLFVVSYESQDAQLAQLKHRVPYLEAGCL